MKKTFSIRNVLAYVTSEAQTTTMMSAKIQPSLYKSCHLLTCPRNDGQVVCAEWLLEEHEPPGTNVFSLSDYQMLGEKLMTYQSLIVWCQRTLFEMK